MAEGFPLTTLKQEGTDELIGGDVQEHRLILAKCRSKHGYRCRREASEWGIPFYFFNSANNADPRFHPSSVVRRSVLRNIWRYEAPKIDEKDNLTPGKYTVTLIPGDGIGKEVADSVKEIFEAYKVPVQWEQHDVLGETTGGDELFQQAMESLKRNKVGLKGESHPLFSGERLFRRTRASTCQRQRRLSGRMPRYAYASRIAL